MSRRNSREEKARRRKERLEKPLHYNPVKEYSFCCVCGNYGIVWMPGKFCTKCVKDML